MRFEDRAEAGIRLAAQVAALAPSRPLVLAIPRGGVVVAEPVARALHAPLDVMVVRKIGAPANPELAVGAVAPGPEVLLDQDLLRRLGLDEDALRPHIARALAELEHRTALYGVNIPADLAGRTVILVDDGVATGHTAEAALRLLRRRRPERLIVAVPVGPPQTLARLRAAADAVVCLLEPPHFYAVGQFYRRFPQVEDDQVLSILQRLRQAGAEGPGDPPHSPATPGKD